MCGRFSLYKVHDALLHFNLKTQGELRPSYNIAPTQLAAVVLSDAPDTAQLVRWGLVPAWAKDVKIGYKMINARAETLQEKPAFKRLLNTRRCVILADGFYEWKGLERQPHRIEYKEPMLLAGLWDEWKHGDETLRTFTIITTTPNEQMKSIHDRMPVILTKQQKDDWLLKANTDLLQPFSKKLTIYKIDKRVNSPQNNDEAIIKKI